jgi:hypothetical protein
VPESKPADRNQQPWDLIIAENGRFVGGDREAATDLVVALLALPANQRRVRVQAPTLDDVIYKRSRPDLYVKLRDGVNLYERALNFLMRGGVNYYRKWVEQDLVEAVIELRVLALLGIEEYESWFVWPVEAPERALKVRFSRHTVDSVRSGFYTEAHRQSMPEDEPIWLKSIFPRIIWERVAPAAALQSVREQAEHSHGVSLDDWVLSDHPPAQLRRHAPSDQLTEMKPESWTW